MLIKVDIKELARKAVESASRKDSFKGFAQQLLSDSIDKWSLGKDEEALSKCEDLINLVPSMQFPKVFKASILTSRNDYVESEAFLMDITKEELDTNTTLLYLFVSALNYFYVNRFSEAIKYCDQFFKCECEDLDTSCAIFFIRGCAYESLEEHKKAIKDFKRCLKAGWQIKGVKVNLAYSYLRNKNYIKAWLIYRRVAKHFPDNWRIQYNAGLSFFRLGMLSKSLPYLQRTEKLNSEFAGTYLTRGYVYLRQGYRELALQDWERARDLGEVDKYNTLMRKYGNR